MELSQLRYFLTVARHNNITHAAEELHISQPSLSKTIAMLEESVGQPLFDRNGKRIVLNEYGKVFAARTNRILSDLAQAQREIADMADAGKKRIIVGATIARLLPKLLSGFLSIHPDVLFNLVQMTNHERIQSELISGKLDLCISILPVELSGAETLRLVNDEILLAVSQTHRLADRKQASLKEIEGERLVHHSAETGLRKITDSFFRRLNMQPEIAFECTTPDIICELTGKGFGCALIPSSWLATVNTSSLSLIKISDFPCERTFWLSWLKDRYMTRASRHFIDYTVKYFAELYLTA